MPVRESQKEKDQKRRAAAATKEGTKLRCSWGTDAVTVEEAKALARLYLGALLDRDLDSGSNLDPCDFCFDVLPDHIGRECRLYPGKTRANVVQAPVVEEAPRGSGSAGYSPVQYKIIERVVDHSGTQVSGIIGERVQREQAEHKSADSGHGEVPEQTFKAPFISNKNYGREVTSGEAAAFLSKHGGPIYSCWTPTAARGVWIGSWTAIVSYYPRAVGEKKDSIQEAFAALNRGNNPLPRIRVVE